jgi:hypothetical protein
VIAQHIFFTRGRDSAIFPINTFVFRRLEHRVKGVPKAMRKSKGVAAFSGRIAAVMMALVAVRSPAKEHTKLSMTPSQLLKNPQKYDGQRVLVRGYVYIGPESRNLSDSKKAYEADTPHTCIGLSAPDIKFNRKDRVYEKENVTLSGIFRSNLCGPNVCLFWCNTAGIELDPDIKLVE